MPITDQDLKLPSDKDIKVELDQIEELRKHPPCLECGAKTLEEAETMCICSGDKDDCHGCELWPD